MGIGFITTALPLARELKLGRRETLLVTEPPSETPVITNAGSYTKFQFAGKNIARNWMNQRNMYVTISFYSVAQQQPAHGWTTQGKNTFTWPQRGLARFWPTCRLE